MKTLHSPLTGNSVQNENLIETQNIDVNQFFVENENNSSENNKYITIFSKYGLLVSIFVI